MSLASAEANSDRGGNEPLDEEAALKGARCCRRIVEGCEGRLRDSGDCEFLNTTLVKAHDSPPRAFLFLLPCLHDAWCWISSKPRMLSFEAFELDGRPSDRCYRIFCLEIMRDVVAPASRLPCQFVLVGWFDGSLRCSRPGTVVTGTGIPAADVTLPFSVH